MFREFFQRIFGTGPVKQQPVNGKRKNFPKRSVKKKKIVQRQPDFLSIIRNSGKMVQARVEESVRTKILDSFLKPSHGDLSAYSRLHLEALEKDPLFYGHLARWYFENGAIRDYQELFASHLLASPFPDHREHGYVLFQFLRPYQAARVARYTKETLSFSTRQLKSAIQFYLKRKENNPPWFDECVIRDKHSMKYLYSSFHVKPGERAERLLFLDAPPQESRVCALKELAKNKDNPAQQAKIILREKIHFTTALGAVKQITPGIVYAFASVMTPQQVINNLRFFEKRGALEDPSTRGLIEEKLRYGATESRVSDFKSLKALSMIRADQDLAEELLDMTNNRLKNRGEIRVPTAIFVDKSGSMGECIQIGKQMASLCSTISTSDLFVYAFDTNAHEIKSSQRDFASWESAFSKIKADGSTSIGIPFRHLMNKDVDQLLIVSDGEENTRPFFRKMLDEYEKKHAKEIKVVFIKVGRAGTTPLEKSMERKDFTVIPFEGDYYNLPNVVPLLAGWAGKDLVDEILKVPLYTKKDLQTLPPGFNEETYEIL